MSRAIAVTLTLLALYWLTVSGTFHSIDEEAVFAVARAIVVEGEATQNALYRAVPYIDQARIGIDGAFYSKYGIGHALALVPALWLAQVVPDATFGSAAMLVNALATALTGGVLTLAARRLGYSAWVGVALGLLYGVATFAWVYAKTMFSEPLVALLWLCAVYPFCKAQGDSPLSRRAILFSGVCLALALSIRPASILVTPLFALFLLQRNWRTTLKNLLLWGVPIAGVGVALLWFNAVRFGSPFDFGYSESFNGNVVVGLQGFLISADRSLFLFAPPLLMLGWGVPLALRRHRALAIPLLIIAIVSLLLYSAWAVFWGGPVWGPRYLLPIVPLLFLLLPPALDRALGASPSRLAQGLWAAVALLGVGIQLPGVLWNSLPMTQTLGQRYPLWLLPPRSEWLDLAWLAEPSGWVLSAILLGIAVAALVRPRLAWVGGAVLAVGIGSLLLLGYLGGSGFGYAWQPNDQSAWDALATESSADDAVVLNLAPYQTPLPRLMSWLNRPHPPASLYGIQRDPAADPAISIPEMNYLLERHARVWLVTEGVAPGDTASVTEQTLVRRAVAVRTTWLTDATRLTLFERALPVTEQPVRVTLDDTITLQTWSVAQEGTGIQVYLEWQPRQSDPRPLHTFVQLLSADGQLISGWDNVPQFGFAPASTWQADSLFQERIALTRPPDVTLSDMQLIVGMYDSATGERLQTETGEDFIVLE